MEQRQPPFRGLEGLEKSLPTSSQASQTAAKLRATKLASIDTTSSYRTAPKSDENTPPVRRKPVPILPIAVSKSSKPPSFSSGGQVVAVGRDSGDNFPVNSVTPPRVPWQQQRSSASPRRQYRDLEGPPPSVFTQDIPQSPGFTPFHELSADQARQVLLGLDTQSYSPSTLTHARHSDPPRSPLTQRNRPNHQGQRSDIMPSRNQGPAPIQIIAPDNSYGANGPPTPNKAGPSKISSFFGWKGNQGTSPINESSPTTISDRSTPAQSPNGTSLSSFPTSNKPNFPHAIDTSKANAPSNAMFANGSFPQAPPTPAMSFQLEEMEEELRDISSELAGSIRREMELEEQVELLQQDGPNALEKDKRTSDYYSDSGTSSVRDPDASATHIEDVEKLKRRSEMEKAALKLDLSQKLQEERTRRKQLEEHIKGLEQHVQNLEQGGGQTRGTGRVQELETALEDNRRRLSQEKKHKDNFEDLISALRDDLIHHKDERDNLRDEVVPSLKARVEGLESESSEYQKLVYENTRMQQELTALRSGRGGISPIVEEGSGGRKMGLARSSSLMRGSSGNMGGLSRSGSVTKPAESRESLADRVKDIEAQRDALHRALKSLLERQRFQVREHEKRVKALEQERDKALEAQSPRRRGYEQEVTDLRYEINELRTRADDALEQKWQCEKGLGGLKKDLDRAEQETSSLRILLVENDILVPDLSLGANHAQANSATLQRAYQELRQAQALSITRLQEMKGITPSPVDDAKTAETMNLLLQSMSNAEAERDFAQKQAESLRARAESLEEVSTFHEGESEGLSSQLKSSAQRVDLLSSQVKTQLNHNSELRERLAMAIGSGEREQKVSTTRIASLQDRLKDLEDRLLTAQQQSEDTILLHEDEVSHMKASDNNNLQRLKSSKSGSPSTPITPRIDNTTSGTGRSMTEVLRTEFLEQRVKELEGALKDADAEMGEVVQRMTMAQIEVQELQSARDEAANRTRALQNRIVAENAKVGTLTASLK